MGKMFLLMEDNGDNTITATVNMGVEGEDHHFVIPLGFNTLISMFPTPENLLDVTSQIIHIPKTPD